MDGGKPCDVLIVGAGPAGCVLARRLTEDPARTVLLVEAGPDYGPDPTQWPADLRDPRSIWPDSHPWGYLHADRPADQPFPLPRARVVGGSSTINACFWLRGSAADYDGWAAAGNPGWTSAELLPYFRRSEADPIGGALHGSDGPVPVFRVPDADLTPVDRAFVAAAAALGFARVDDFNGDPVQGPGIGPMPRNVADGVRVNAAFSYLAPARARPNLRLISDALVDRVCVKDGRAEGVRLADGREFRGREVILSAGAFGSPSILLRTGIGPATHLREHGLEVIADRPGVGACLLDHPMLNSYTDFAVKPEFTPAATSFNPNLLKARSRQVSEEIDLHVYHSQSFDEERGIWVFWQSISLEYARSRGWLRLTSSDPSATLQIDHRHLSDPADLEALCDGVELVARLVSTPPLATMIEPLTRFFPAWDDRDELRAAVREQVVTTFHPSSTCRMGPASDPDAVVDHEGRVHGIAGLRVVDASIFPTGPRANLHSTVVAVAEKLADAIRADDGP